MSFPLSELIRQLAHRVTEPQAQDPAENEPG